ncbi:MAG: C4-dicarboxylate ABC transporter substrate-binding protein [Proteobacteria bacterium]|nr:C4-dicarboxylate ABC transporter substrate-binding protein [Pseudomonadota bacterium]
MTRNWFDMRILVATTFMASVLLAAAIPIRAAESKVIYLTHQNNNDPGDTATAAAAVAFKRAVKNMLDGTIQVEIFPSGQVGNDNSTLELVREGIIQAAIVSVGSISGIYPRVSVLDFPFVWQDIEETYVVFDGPFGKRLAQDFTEETGLALLGFLDSGGLFLLTNDNRAVRNPTDMKGLRIRTMGLESHNTFVRSLGATPVAIQWESLVTAIQTRVVDGQMNPAAVIRFAHLDDIQRYATAIHHFYTPYFWVFNQAFLDSLTENERLIVHRAARSGIQASRALSKSQVGAHDAALAGRMEIHHPTETEMAAFRDASQPVMRTHIAATLGEEGIALLDVFLATIKDARVKR